MLNEVFCINWRRGDTSSSWYAVCACVITNKIGVSTEMSLWFVVIYTTQTELKVADQSRQGKLKPGEQIADA